MNNSELVSLIYALMEGPWRRLVREAGAARRLMGSPEPRGGCGPRCRDWAKRWRCHPRNVFRTRLVFPQSAQAFSRELKCVIGLNVLRQDSVEPPPRAAKTERPLTTLPDAEGPPPVLARGLTHRLVWPPPLILETRSWSKDLPGWPGHLASPKKGPAGTDARALGVFSPKAAAWMAALGVRVERLGGGREDGRRPSTAKIV